jgi:hypothetical protein
MKKYLELPYVLNREAHGWISFRMKRSKLALFPGVCCIHHHPKHITAVLKAPNIGARTYDKLTGIYNVTELRD